MCEKSCWTRLVTETVLSCLSWGVTKKQQESRGENLPKHTLTFHFQKVHCPPLEDSVWFYDKYVLDGYFLFFKNYPVIASGYSMSVQQIWVSFTVPTFLCGACWGWLLSFNPFDCAVCLRWSATFNVNPSQSNKTNGKGKKMHKHTHRNRGHAFIVYVCVVLEHR